MSVCVQAETGGDEGKKDNNDFVVIWKMAGYLYNLAVTWHDSLSVCESI